jgi:hypothetical protein
MKANGLIVATISWARNEGEEKVLRTSLQQLAELDIRVCITDGGSTGSFLEFLHSIPHFIVRRAQGLWPQARLSITTAMENGAKYIFYTEPDKLQFFSNHLKQMFNAIEIEETGVVVASRSPKVFQAFRHFSKLRKQPLTIVAKKLLVKKWIIVTGLSYLIQTWFLT